MATANQRRLVEAICADGRVDSPELEAIHAEFGDGTQLSRDEADLLAEMFKRIERRNPGFEEYFFRCVKNYVRTHAAGEPDLAAWLGRLLGTKGISTDSRSTLLHELKGEMKDPTSAFQALFGETCAGAY